MKKLPPIDLSELQPAGMAPPDAGKQQRKSSGTRTAILDAAIECLAKFGYARTTTPLIAEMAKVSRGAMLHHYSTRMELIESVIDYAFFCHLEQFSKAIRALSVNQRVKENSGIFIDWQLYQSPTHRAYLELTVAAQTDEDLRALFIPKAQVHDRVWRDELLAVFPEWAGDMELLNSSRRLVHAVLSGIILHRDVWQDPAMEKRLVEFLAEIVIKLHSRDLAFGVTAGK